MSTTLAQLIAATRATFPLFDVRRVPDKAIGDFMGQCQRRLSALAHQKNRTYRAQSASILIDAVTANRIDNVGAGETGGLPGGVTSGAATFVGTAPAGMLVEIDFDDAVVSLVAPEAITSATANTITLSGATWTTNAFANQYVRIVAGTGVGERRKIVSNTATVITTSSSEPWDPALASDTVFEVVQPTLEASGELTGVTRLPATDGRIGYVVSLDSAGQPRIDLTAPLTATIDSALPLPEHHAILGGTVRFTGDTDTMPLVILEYGARHAATPFPAVWIGGGTMKLAGPAEDWGGVESVELQYVPVPPLFTARTDYVALPDAATPALVAHGAAFCALHVEGLGESVNVDRFDAKAMDAERVYLTDVAMQTRGRSHRVREVF